MEITVHTNIGDMPLDDYLDIKAIEYGFDDYEDMVEHGFRLDGDEYAGIQG